MHSLSLAVRIFDFITFRVYYRPPSLSLGFIWSRIYLGYEINAKVASVLELEKALFREVLLLLSTL